VKGDPDKWGKGKITIQGGGGAGDLDQSGKVQFTRRDLSRKNNILRKKDDQSVN